MLISLFFDPNQRFLLIFFLFLLDLKLIFYRSFRTQLRMYFCSSFQKIWMSVRIIIQWPTLHKLLSMRPRIVILSLIQSDNFLIWSTMMLHRRRLPRIMPGLTQTCMISLDRRIDLWTLKTLEVLVCTTQWWMSLGLLLWHWSKLMRFFSLSYFFILILVNFKSICLCFCNDRATWGIWGKQYKSLI